MGKGWLEGNTGNTAPRVIRVILLRGDKYLELRKARIGQSSNVGRKGLPWLGHIAAFPESTFSNVAGDREVS